MIAFAALIAPLSISFAFLIMGLLSRRFGFATRAKPYYVGLFIAAALMMISVLFQLFFLLLPANIVLSPTLELIRILSLEGLPALAITLALIVAWRYWSWLD